MTLFFAQFSKSAMLNRKCYNLYLADFLKTNLTKFAVIRVKKRQKACFLSPGSSKITVTKEKGKKERARRRKGGEEKKALVALSVFIIATLKIVFDGKNCSTQKVHLTITLSKIQLDIYNVT